MKLLSIAPLLYLLMLVSVPHQEKKPKLPEEFVFIPAGSFYTATPEEDPSFFGLTRDKKPMDSSKIWYTEGFYMSKYEVTNLQYKQFYNEVAPMLSGEELAAILCDSSGWNNVTLYYNQPHTTSYYRHPAFNKFPVVNITYEGAQRYCAWLQQKIQQANPGYIIEVRLPAKFEWRWAAMGGHYQAVYPWSDAGLINRKGENMCNFKKVTDAQIIRNRKTGLPEIPEAKWSEFSESGFYTMKAESYTPNDYGLYNMCGNAAEMITEKGTAMGGSWNDFGGDVNTRAEAPYTGFANTIGFRPVIIVKNKITTP